MSAPGELNLFDPAVQDDPYTAYEALRRTAPVYREPLSGMYVVTRYEDVRAVLRDTERFRNGLRPSTGGPERTARQREILELYREKGWVPAPSLAGYDGERHKQIRSIFTKAFRASKIRQLEPYVEDTARNLVDAFASDGSCDVVSALAVPLPLLVIGRQMGVPDDDIWRIKAWTDAWVQRLGMMQTPELGRASRCAA